MQSLNTQNTIFHFLYNWWKLNMIYIIIGSLIKVYQNTPYRINININEFPFVKKKKIDELLYFNK